MTMRQATRVAAPLARPRRRFLLAMHAAALVLGLSAFNTVWAADAAALLQGFVSNTQSATGSFTQTVKSVSGETRSVQRGTFAFQRPGKFVWHTTDPYPQQVVSDGTSLYQYDPDLAQVTVRDVNSSLGASPAQILFGSGSLSAAFKLDNLPDEQGRAWLRAVPRSADAGFAHLDIGFVQGQPERLRLLDAFGQQTDIVFTDFNANASVPAGQFRFVAPPGTDVVNMNAGRSAP